MVRYLILFLLLAPLHCTAQFRTVRAASETKVTTPYYHQLDFSDIDIHFDYTQLAGEELYFARRSTLAGGAADSVAAFKGMDGYFPEPINKMVDDMLSAETNTADGFWHFSGRNVMPATRFYQPDITYTTTTYRPAITVNKADHSLTAVTPYATVEDRFFTVVSCTDSANNGLFVYLNFHLIDDSGIHFRWVVYTRDLWKLPVHLKSYLPHLRREQLGTTYCFDPRDKRPRNIMNVLTNTTDTLHPGNRFTVTDLVFIDSRYNACAMPWLIFEDRNGKDIAVAPTAGKPYPSNAPWVGHL